MLILDYQQFSFEYIFQVLNIFKLLLFPLILLIYITIFSTYLSNYSWCMIPFKLDLEFSKTAANEAMKALKKVSAENPRSAIVAGVIAGAGALTVNYGYTQQTQILNTTKTLRIDLSNIHPGAQITKEKLFELAKLRLDGNSSAINIAYQDIKRSFHGEPTIVSAYQNSAINAFLKNREAIVQDYLNNKQSFLLVLLNH